MKYRKKPIVIDAVQWDGKNLNEIKDFAGKNVEFAWMWQMDDDVPHDYLCLIIHTLEGDMRASEGDYIIRGINGEYYACKPDVFEKTYEKVKEDKSKEKKVKEIRRGQDVYIRINGGEWHKLDDAKCSSIDLTDLMFFL